MLDDLILFYIMTRVVDSKEMALERLVSLTDESNYDHIVSEIKNNKYSSELDLSMYIREIATKPFSGLKKVIKNLLLNYRDKSAIQDLQYSLVKVG